MLAGISEGVLMQLERTGLLELIGRDNVFQAQSQGGQPPIRLLKPLSYGWRRIGRR
jgi:hypothetical protein